LFVSAEPAAQYTLRNPLRRVSVPPYPNSAERHSFSVGSQNRWADFLAAKPNTIVTHRRRIMRTTQATTAIVVLTIGFLGIAQSAQAHQCTLANAAGRYGYTSNGSIVTPPVGLFTAVGHVAFTETGTFSGAQTTSVAGNLVDETVQGTYTVSPDCTGSATVYVYHGSTLARVSHINLVWDLHQNQVRAIFLTPGTNISIEGRKMAAED